MTSEPHSNDQVGNGVSSSASHDSERLPLQGMRVIELANIVAGPSVGKYLSDFGAEVIKVERPGDGDSARAMGASLGEQSAWWLVSVETRRRLRSTSVIQRAAMSCCGSFAS